MNLRWYQQESIQSIFTYFENGNTGNPVIALPTGTGKSLVIAGFVQKVLRMWPRQRFMVLTHVKELIEQNHGKLMQAWPTCPAGIYSAGLKQKDVMDSVIFGGCASVVKTIEAFGHRDLLIIDEAHLLSPKEGTTYQQIINRLKVINPYLKVIGLTATPYRLGQGLITDDGVFTDIIYDMTGIDGFQTLIAEGYLATLVPKKTETELDTSSVAIASTGDFQLNQLQAAVDRKDVTERALRELVAHGHDRKSWIIFSSGVEHAEHISEMLNEWGIPSAAVHSKMPSARRDEILRDYKSGALRCVVNNNVLTTGFDHPPIDLVGMLRPTVSPGLWVQMLGRATRPCEGKPNALVLDFAGNTLRLGPINDPIRPRKKGQRAGEAPVKLCEACGVFNHASARVCFHCGYVFPVRQKIAATAGTADLIRGEVCIEWFDVKNVFYSRHQKAGKPDSMKVIYQCGLRQFYEWVCPEHGGYASKKARDWFRKRSDLDLPDTLNGFIEKSMFYKKPKKIKVWLKKEGDQILDYEL